jgi:hypothetical protein
MCPHRIPGHDILELVAALAEVIVKFSTFVPPRAKLQSGQLIERAETYCNFVFDRGIAVGYGLPYHFLMHRRDLAPKISPQSLHPFI